MHQAERIEMDQEIGKSEHGEQGQENQIAPCELLQGGRDRQRESGQEREIDHRRRSRRRAAERYPEPAAQPEAGKNGKPPAAHWLDAAPARRRSQEEAREDRRGVAEQHLVPVPERRRQGGLETDPAGVQAEPERHRERAVQPREQEEGPKAVGEQAQRLRARSGACNASHDAHSSGQSIASESGSGAGNSLISIKPEEVARGRACSGQQL